MSFVSALMGPVSDGTRASTPSAYHRDAAPAILDLHRGRQSYRAGQLLITKKDFSIRVADESRAASVDKLVTRMYRSRGYLVADDGCRPSVSDRGTVTLEALSGRTTIGTLTVNLGQRRRLNAETLYAEEIAPYRQPGRRLCEFNRLALHMDETSKEVLAAIFHVGVVFAAKIFGASDLFIEVNPRHAPFYRRKIGFALAGEERVCPRVDAPAVLLHKDLAVCTEELARLGGVRTPDNKSFYAFALTPAEERIVLGNILAPLRMAS